MKSTRGVEGVGSNFFKPSLSFLNLSMQETNKWSDSSLLISPSLFLAFPSASRNLMILIC